MIYKKITYLVCIVGFVFSNFVYSKNNEAPVYCPNAAVIKVLPFSDAKPTDNPHLWTVTQSKNNYETQQEWSFILVVEANDQQDAFRKANKALPYLRNLRGPLGIDYFWLCDYEADSAISAVAVTHVT